MPLDNNLEQGGNDSPPFKPWSRSPETQFKVSPPIPSTDGSSNFPSIQDVDRTSRKGHGIRRLVTLCGSITQLLAEKDSRLHAPDSDAESDASNNSNHDMGLTVERKEERRRWVPHEVTTQPSPHGWNPQVPQPQLWVVPPAYQAASFLEESGHRSTQWVEVAILCPGKLIILFIVNILLEPSQLHDGTNNAYSNDTSWVKSGVVSLLNNRGVNCADPPLDPNTRDGRGLHNDFTGKLLCPIKYAWDDPRWVFFYHP